MANTYFQFKQFTVHQAHSAMKVCTDACLFGAWAAVDPVFNNAKTILDIGAGTGLLSLMIAQATSTSAELENITAIEIEVGAANEATNNFKASPWNNKLHVMHSSIQDFCKAYIGEKESSNNQFDCIISNPPFFETDLPSQDIHKNTALHSTHLPWSELIASVHTLLKPSGTYFVLIPALRAYTMQKLASEVGLELIEEVVVMHAAKQKPFRVFQKFIKPVSPIKSIKRSSFHIKDNENKYSDRFIELLSPYYLHL